MSVPGHPARRADEKQGRVFGFAMMFEAGPAPITALLVAPIAEPRAEPAQVDG
jgi:hypothetical protein